MKLIFSLFFFLLVNNVAVAAVDPLTEWLQNRKEWAEGRIQEGATGKRVSEFVDYYLPDTKIKINPSEQEKENSRKTKELFHQYFPLHDPGSYVGTFFESGHPYVLSKYGPYQWNSLKDSGMDDHVLFRKVIKTLVKERIRTFRLAPLLHEKNQDKFLEKIRIIWEEGGTPIITIVWFPSFKPWEVKTKGKIDFPKSYILNPKWPGDVESFARKLLTRVWQLAAELEKKKGKKLTALVNGVNEPETLAGFNRHFWHGAFANWFHPENFKYYILSAIRIGEANVRIRRAVDETSKGRRVLFVHNEAMTPDYYPSHGGKGKYTVSKFMLGDDVLLKANWDEWKKEPIEQMEKRLKEKEEVNEIEWSFREFVFGKFNKTKKDKEKARTQLITELQKLQTFHFELQNKTGKSVKTDSLLYLDYYYQTEFLPLIPIPTLASTLSSKEKLKQVLRARDDEALFHIIKGAFERIDKDFAPMGPEGPILPFKATNINEIDFSSIFESNDYLILERLIGLRREYNFVEKEPFNARRLALGIEDRKEIFRLDHIVDKLLSDDNKILRSILKVKDNKELDNQLRKVALDLKVPIKKELSVREILDADGREVLHHILGIKRDFFLGFEPQHYPRQIRAGIRHGFYHFFMSYINALRIFTVGVGESGTPYYYFANLLHNQVMMEYVTALESGVEGTQYVFGPAVDTVGWARSPLGHHWKEDHEVNPSGILKIEGNEPVFRGDDYLKTKWAIDFMNSVFKNMNQ